MNDYHKFSCGHTIYSTLTQLYRHSSWAQETYGKFEADHKATLNELCTISMSGPRGTGWDTGLSMFIENEIIDDTELPSYPSSKKDAIVICPTIAMAELLIDKFKNTTGNKFDFMNSNHASILITSLGSNDFLGFNTNKIIFHNYTLMKKIPLHKKKLKQVEHSLIPVISSHKKKFLIKIC